MPEPSPTRFTMVPARRSNEPTARRRARRILYVLYLAAALSVAATAISVANGRSGREAPPAEPEGRSLAHAAAMSYLSGGPLNVPHAASFDPEQAAPPATGRAEGEGGPPLPYRSLSWVGFTPQHFGSKELGFTDFEIHHFLVMLPAPEEPDRDGNEAGTEPAPTASPRERPGTRASRGATPSASPSRSADGSPTTSPSATPSATPSGSPSGSPSATPSGSPSASPTPGAGPQVLRLDVPVLLSAQGPRLAAAPAFSARGDQPGQAVGQGDYTGYRDLVTPVGDRVKEQVGRWAHAYVTGDSAALLALTGDQNADHRYVGLSGFTLPDSARSVQVLSAIRASGGRLIVRVRVLLARAPQAGTAPEEPPEGATAGRFTVHADFDLLVGAPEGVRPPVLAWGPAGSAAGLEPFSNAYTTR